MKPVTFECRARTKRLPRDIAEGILDLSQWSNFRGYGPLPGIRSAEFEHRTPSIVGSRIRVINRDGSTHVEEILEWDPDQRICLRMSDFSPPLGMLATSFQEVWHFERREEQTEIIRTFQLVPRYSKAWLVLWGISWMLKAAINRHLRQIV